MVKPYLSQMVMHHIKKVYILLESIISLIILSCMMLFTINSYKQIDLSHLDFINDFLDKKVDSYINKRRNDVDNYNIYFNEKGNINIGQTIHLNNHRIIIHLGNGYLTYE